MQSKTVTFGRIDKHEPVRIPTAEDHGRAKWIRDLARDVAVLKPSGIYSLTPAEQTAALDDPHDL